MKLSEGIKHKGCPYEVPDSTRLEFPEFFKSLGYKKGIEIGTYKAEYTVEFAKAGLEIYTVDPWMIYRDYSNPKGQARLDFQYEHSCRVLKPYPNAHVIRATSMDALSEFEDGSLDFVYIDGNHIFKNVAEDLWEWSRKVRKGGIVAGHDYLDPQPGRPFSVCHVRPLLNAFIEIYDIKNYWVTSGRKQETGVARDLWKSWFWFKDYEDWPFVNKNYMK